MYILGIETSCDETAAAVLESSKSLGPSGLKILFNVVASSIEFHKKYGGIVPEVAAREQLRCIIPVIDESIKSSKGIKSIKEIDAIAVTIGPGLIGSLLVGVETAKTLSFVWNKPIIPINHLLAHFYAIFLNSKFKTRNSKLFPAVGLIASGGHTELVLMKNHGDYNWLGGTRDDAAGECFDKTARLLGLPYPGGPAIEAAASSIINYPRQRRVRLWRKSSIINHLPRPMLNQENFDFSFSGLKTAVMRLRTTVDSRQSTVNSLAASIQEAITDVLVEKTVRAAKKYQAKSIIVAGGVAANKRLKEKFQSAISNQRLAINLFIPPPYLCTDNAAFIAACAFYNFKPVPWQKIQANVSLSL
jgi:N6-L-threonylcarbamoyladenine synthase